MTAVDLVRTAARLQRVLELVERGAFAVIAGIGGVYVAASVIVRGDR